MSDDSAAEAAERLAEALQEAGVPPTAAVLVPPPTRDSPPPPEGPWVVVALGEGFAVGAMGRGRFAEYVRVASFDAALELVARLLTEPAASRPSGREDALSMGQRTAAAITERTGRRGGASGTALLAPGDAVDLLGPETGHHVYALGTPFPQRSQPPTDVGRPYHRYEVRSALPDATEGVCAPWFEQPGGGAMVVLTRPVRWYVDQGHLVELVEPEADRERRPA